MSGYRGSSLASAGHSIVSAACSAAVMRIVARRLVAQFAQRREFGVDLVEPRAERAQQPLAGLGRGDTARRARQQPQAQPRLQCADRLAQRRLRDAELRRGPREAALPRDREERDEIVEVVSRHS